MRTSRKKEIVTKATIIKQNKDKSSDFCVVHAVVMSL